MKALTDGVLLALHRDDFNALLGSLTHLRHMWRFEALRKVHACPSCILPSCFAAEYCVHAWPDMMCACLYQ